MHDHQEVSNTAAGGNYPQGCVTHFQFDGAMRPEDEVIVLDRAELRVRTGELRLSGRISRSRISDEIMVHAGPDMSGPMIGMATVTTTAQGLHTWTFRGRALQALASRKVSLHAAGAGSNGLLHGVTLTVR
jgi:hypothetical protein